ncbi:hypothetical protein AB7M56_007335 [Bradyrhizobium elkanii]|jgi:hypothetical protein|uniref:Uncharacterized protein n=1 Tax=Bradyrhizobium elkanii TaxID=29448 RepID=A0A8I1Y0Z5_BRAEL|nr:hypothetical protein [Bradyrhizobium elkanii]MCS4008539.1 hypothetical protein [Bradyrhizobium elkanii USDA 61]MCP1928136.1 hypothetical protein [Bradyrhizobium elkanii]MCP1973399.1 hypothetical protein [Bradyrhizobium elkanii]MCS3474469.1 hypothetical protein [Bradyrhizobium elkanii]
MATSVGGFFHSAERHPCARGRVSAYPRKRETTEVRPIQLNLISIWAHGTKAGTGDDGPRHEYRRRNIRLLSFF